MATYTNTVRDPSLTVSLAGTPVSGDTVYLTDGKDSYTGGLNLTGVDLFLLHATPGFGGDIAGTYLQLQANRTATGKIKLEWSGRTFNLNMDAGVVNQLEINPAANGTVNLANGNATLCIQNAGTSLWADSAYPTTHRQTGGQSFFDRGGTASTTVYVDGGVSFMNRDFGTANVNAGMLLVNDTTCTPTTVNVSGTGTFKAIKCGTITNLNANSGVVDFSELAQNITVSNRALGPNCTLKMPRSGATITWSSIADVGPGPKYA